MTVWFLEGSWGIVVVGALLVVCAIYLDLRHHHDARMARRWVPRARAQGRWAGPVALAGSLALLVGYVMLALLGSALGTAAGDPRWGLVVSLPAMLAEAGADDRLQRAIAWWAGLPSFGGMIAMVATLVPIFSD